MANSPEITEQMRELELRKLALEVEQLQHSLKTAKSPRRQVIGMVATIGAIVTPLLIGMGTMYVQLRDQIARVEQAERQTSLQISRDFASLAQDLVSDDPYLPFQVLTSLWAYGSAALPILIESLAIPHSPFVFEGIERALLDILETEPTRAQYVFASPQSLTKDELQTRRPDPGILIYLFNLMTSVAVQHEDIRPVVRGYLEDLLSEMLGDKQGLRSVFMDDERAQLAASLSEFIAQLDDDR